MKQLLIIAILSFLVAGCSKESDNIPTSIDKTQWSSIENATGQDIVDILDAKLRGYWITFDLYDVNLICCSGDTISYTTGIFKYTPPDLAIEAKGGKTLKYKVKGNRLELNGDNSMFEHSKVRFPTTLYRFSHN